MNKKSITILLALAMVLMLFAVACGDDSKTSSDADDSRQLDDGDEVEAARGSDTSGEFNFEKITLDDWIRIGEPDDASYRGTSFDKDNLVSADEK